MNYKIAPLIVVGNNNILYIWTWDPCEHQVDHKFFCLMKHLCLNIVFSFPGMFLFMLYWCAVCCDCWAHILAVPPSPTYKQFELGGFLYFQTRTRTANQKSSVCIKMWLVSAHLTTTAGAHKNTREFFVI
jgi:hypothetical protein